MLQMPQHSASTVLRQISEFGTQSFVEILKLEHNFMVDRNVQRKIRFAFRIPYFRSTAHAITLVGARR